MATDLDSGQIKSGITMIDMVNTLAVSGARCAGALSCWNVNVSLNIPLMTDSGYKAFRHAMFSGEGMIHLMPFSLVKPYSNITLSMF